VDRLPDRGERTAQFDAGRRRAFEAVLSVTFNRESGGYRIRFEDANEMRVPPSLLKPHSGCGNDWFVDDGSDDDSGALDADEIDNSLVTSVASGVTSSDPEVSASGDAFDELIRLSIPSDAVDPSSRGLDVDFLEAAAGSDFRAAVCRAEYEVVSSETEESMAAPASPSTTLPSLEAPASSAVGAYPYDTYIRGKMYVRQPDGSHKQMWISTVVSMLSSIGNKPASADRLVRIAEAAKASKKIEVSGGVTVGSDVAVLFTDRVWYGRVLRYGKFNATTRCLSPFIAPLDLDTERVPGVHFYLSWYDDAPLERLVDSGLPGHCASDVSESAAPWLTFGPTDLEPGV
jgi:hypothetical protein